MSRDSNKWQLRRHFVSSAEPQILAIPQEVMDIIMAHFQLNIGDTWMAPDKGWWKLRLVSRTFKLGLFSHFADAITQRKLHFGLDD